MIMNNVDSAARAAQWAARAAVEAAMKDARAAARVAALADYDLSADRADDDAKYAEWVAKAADNNNNTTYKG